MLIYWVDGMCLLALLIAAIFIRGTAMLRRTRIRSRDLIFQGLIGFTMFFGLLSIPYWMVYVGARPRRADVACVGELGADGVDARDSAREPRRCLPTQTSECRSKSSKKLAASEMELLATRGVAMFVVASWTSGVLLAPVFAVVLTAFEVWPQVKQDWNRLDETPVP